MRILICTNSLGAFGGIEKITIVKANAISSIPDNHVNIAYTDKGTYPEKTIHPISPKVCIHDLGVTFWDLPPLNPKSLIWDLPIKTLQLRKALKKLIEKLKPDIIITTGSYEKYALATIRTKAKKVREYHFASKYYQYTQQSRLLALTHWIDTHLLWRCYDLNLLLTKADLEENFKGNRWFDFQHNPCTIQSKPYVLQRTNTVVAIGRLTKDKNLTDLLEIWSIVAVKHTDWRLLIAGEGDQKHRLIEMARQLNIQDVTTFIGHRDDIPQILAKSKILCSTSLHEGFNLTLVEAMTMGAVPIAYDSPYGAREIIQDGENGIVIPYKDKDTYAECLDRMIQDEDALHRMSENAMLRAKDFEETKIITSLMKKLEKLTKNGYSHTHSPTL